MKKTKIFMLTIITIVISLIFTVTASAKSGADDLWDGANIMQINGSASGNISDQFDVDFYRIYISYEGNLFLSFNHTDLGSSDKYWTITIYDQNKKPIVTEKVMGSGTKYEIENISVKKGDYYISVAKGSHHSDTSYTLSNTVTYNVVNEQVYTGSLITKLDTKTYGLNMANPGFVELSAWSNQSGLTLTRDYWTVTIYNSNGSSAFSYSFLGDTSTQTTPKIGLDAGNYRLVVAAASYFTSTEFALKAKVTYSNYWEKEGNASVSSATPILTNATYSGTLKTDSDVDMYKVTVTTDGVLDVNFSHEFFNDSQERWTVSVVNAELTSYMTYNISGQTDNYNLPRFGVPAGTYYIKVTAYVKNSSYTYWSTRKYDLTVNFTSGSNWEKEPNGDIGISTPINANTTYNGTLKNSSDTDVYRITVTTDGVLNINFTHAYFNDDQYRWTVTVMDERYNVYMSYLINGQTDNYNLPKLGIPAGTYYIKVTAYVKNSSYTYCSTIPYELTANFTSTDKWEKEFNGGTENATSINVNTTYNGTIKNSEDVDYYKITVSSAGVLDINISHAFFNDTQARWTIYLMDEKSNILVSYNGISGTTESYNLPSVGVSAGTYYIKVTAYVKNSSYTYCSTIPYELTANFTSTDKWEKENASNYSTAIDMNETYNGTITGTDDTDWYHFELYNTSDITLRFDTVVYNNTNYYYAVYVTDSKFNNIKSYSITNKAGTNSFNISNLNPGVYYVRVIYYKNLSVAKYGLTVSQVHTCSGSWRTVEQPGCFDYGYKEKKCSTCNALLETSYIEPQGHRFSGYSVTDDTYHTRVCTVCDYEEKHNHVWNSGTITTEATCDTTGIKTYVCTFCLDTSEETVPMLSSHIINGWEYLDEEHHKSKCDCGEITNNLHTFVEKIIESATCTSDGTLEKKCSDCGYVYTESIPAAGHSYGEWSVYINAKCSDAGVERRVCNTCNQIESREIMPTGHNYQTDWTIDIAPSCVSVGSKSHHCIVCDDRSDISEVAATGHDFSEWRDLPAPTCTSDGINRRECNICNHYETKTISAFGHSFTNYISNNDAMCTVDGTETAKCDRCDLTDTRTAVETAFGHNYNIAVVDPTCTTEGYTIHTCSVCGDYYVYDEVDALGHISGGVVVENNAAPNCENTGSYDNVVYCTVCDAELSRETIIVDALGHDYKTTWNSNSTSHWHECSCGAKSNVEEHVFDNSCDTTCNICKVVRTVEPHKYDNDCDANCNICDEARAVTPHKYDNACDTTCNVCANQRVITHSYDDKYDKLCNVCQESRKVPMKPVAITFISFSGTTLTAGAGFSIYWFAIKKKSWSELVAILKTAVSNIEKLIKKG